MGTCCSSKADIIASTQPETNMRLINKMKSTDNGDLGSSSDEETYREFDTAMAHSGEDTDISDDDDIPMSIQDKQLILVGFMNAIRKSNDSLVKYYLNEHPSLNLLKTRFENNNTCLHIAVKNKAFEIIKFLLAQDESIISPNFQNDDGDTSLHTAAYSREVDSVLLLIKSNKADAEVSNHNKETALQIAIANKDIEIIKLLTPTLQMSNDENDNEPIWKSASFPSRDRSYNAQIGQSDDENVDEETEEILYQDLNQISNAKKDKHLERSQSLQSIGQNDKNKMHSDEQMKRLKAIQISRSNPFTKLTKMSSKKKLMDVKDAAQSLPKLSAWLEIKSIKPPYSWVKRWVIVEDTYFLWCAKQKIIKNVDSAKERDKFRGHFKLTNIKSIERLKDKSGRKFMIVQEAGSQKVKKEFKFRAASRGDCDHWCDGLQIHIDHCMEMLKYLGTKSP